VGDGGVEVGGSGEEAGDGGGFDGFVETGVLDGGSDDEAAVASGDDVDAGGAEDVVEDVGRAEADGGHLAFAGVDAERTVGGDGEGWEVGPGTGAVDEVVGGDGFGGGLDDDLAAYAVDGDDVN